eukprot:Skav226652  [mRNA]  locus=scaffold1:165403:168428:- [translate_table: standard]
MLRRAGVRIFSALEVSTETFTMQSMPMMPPTSGSVNRGPPQGFQSMPPQVGGPQDGVPMSGPPMSAASVQGGFQPGPQNSMPNMGSMPAMPGGGGSMAYGAPGPVQGPPLAMQGQFMPNVSRPQMTSVANPPVVAGNIQYGPSYKMQYQKRSTSDKSAVKCAVKISLTIGKMMNFGTTLWNLTPAAGHSTTAVFSCRYTGFLPLEGVYEEDTCRLILSA